MAPQDCSESNALLVALGHPLRRRILREMADEKPLSPRMLALTLRRPLSNVSYHVRVLADCGAVTLVRTQPAGGSMEHFYRCAVEAAWARQVLGLGESGGGGTGESSGDAET